jgi:preprotein translocase subunit SecA
MLHVLDEKWKDHLYDLDQLRGAIHYRSWGQKDPLIEYKQEAYTMFVDLMNDIYHTFSERFFHVQLVFDEPAPLRRRVGRTARTATAAGGSRWCRSRRATADQAVQRARHPRGHPAEELRAPRTRGRRDAGGMLGTVEIGPDESPNDGDVLARPRAGRRRRPRMRADGTVADRRRTRATGRRCGATTRAPCGSGRKFKKCHGATL